MYVNGTEVTVSEGETVMGAYEYRVVVAGTYGLLELIPCQKTHEQPGYATCAFLGATVAGLEPTEVD